MHLTPQSKIQKKQEQQAKMNFRLEALYFRLKAFFISEQDKYSVSMLTTETFQKKV